MLPCVESKLVGLLYQRDLTSFVYVVPSYNAKVYRPTNIWDFGGGRVILEFSHIFYAFLGVLTVTDIFVR